MIVFSCLFLLLGHAQQVTNPAILAAAEAEAQAEAARAKTKTEASAGTPETAAKGMDHFRSSPFCDSRKLNQYLVSVDYRDAVYSGFEEGLNGFGREFPEDAVRPYKIKFKDPSGRELPPVEVVCSRNID